MSVSDVLKLYNNGDWNICYKLFSKYPSEASKDKIELNIKLNGYDEMTKNCLFENNALLCETLQVKRASINWSECMDRFINLYSIYRSLTIPLDLELNIVYNIQWWFSIQPEMFKYKSLYFRRVLDVVSKVIVKVLKTHEDVVLDQEPFFYNVRRFINLLMRASDVLLHLSSITCMQLLDVIMLNILIFLRSHDDESYIQCKPLINKCFNQLDLLKLHIQQKVVSGNEDIYFKFGLTSINSTASLNNCSERLDAIVIIGSLVCAANEEYALCIDYLNRGSNVKANPFQFLINYLKAHCYFHLKQYNEAKLQLVYSTTCSSFSQYDGYYRLLLARILSEQNEDEAALTHCETISSVPRQVLRSLAYHLAATVAQKLLIPTAQIMYLKNLVQSLKCTKEEIQFEGFQECCFSVLCEKYYITLQEALYLLAKQLYLAGYHGKALTSYCELMDLLRTNTGEHRRSKWLPEKVQVLHETILAHVKANNLKGGEMLCRQLIREYVPITTKGMKDECVWEAVLFSLEDDIVSMTLLADILAHTDKKKALDELNRCYNALSESVEHAATLGESENLKELCDWFMSRILLRKAKLSSVDDAAHYFRRALMQKPGDKEVVFHYKQWALWHPDHESFDPGDKVVQFPVNQLHNLALSHILGCSVTDEEWMTVCDQESSQNVLEALFDDDD